jgi:nitroreductase
MVVFRASEQCNRCNREPCCDHGRVDPSDLAELIRGRRTSIDVDQQRAVPRDIVCQLCELAQWAPNHRRTWPWRFAIAEGEGRARLGAVIAEAMERRGDAPERVAKVRAKYLRTPTMLVVGSVPGATEQQTTENRDAVAAGIENILLAATAHGLATYWTSCPKGANDVVVELCEFEPGTHISGLIHLGYASATVEPPQRPAPDVHVL